MSNTILIDQLWGRLRHLGIAITVLALSAACSMPSNAQNEVQSEEQNEEAARQETGTPATSSGNSSQSASRSYVIGMEEMPDKFPERRNAAGCFITFAYRGHEPETLIWDGEPCTQLTARFGDKSFLEEYGNWDQLNQTEKTQVANGPDGQVFYVEGEFTASIYPIGINGLTYEVVVSD